MSVYKQQRNNIFKTWVLIFIFIFLISIVCYGVGFITKNPLIGYFGFAISIGQSFIGYFFGGSLAISSAGGVQIDQKTEPEIYNIVENLSKIAGIPIPKIFISPDPSANAFACGRDPKHANICLNQGILELLDKNELEGVIAHELSHIKNRDILIMTLTMVLTSVITLITDIAFRSMFFSRNSDDNDNKSPIIFILYIVVLMISPIISAVISMAVSREREFLADATAITLTRYPGGLISALEKLYKSPIPTEHFSASTSHFYISPPKKTFGEKVSHLFSTHPKIEERILALREM